jgi:copper chaperone CopZ
MKFLRIFVAFMAIYAGAAKAQFVKADLQVSGLTCSMCSKATEKSLRTLPFISDIKADLNRNLFTITFKPGTPVDLDLMGKKVQGAGFAINQLKATINFNQVKLDNNSFTYAGHTFHLLNAGSKKPDGLEEAVVIKKGFTPTATLKKYPAALSTGNSEKVYGLAI